MKQAILITAYQNLTHLKKIIEWFDEDFDFYIHIDKKCKETYDFLSVYKNVKVYQHYTIYWGSDQHLLAIWFLIKKTIEANSSYTFCHLITGSDFPIKSKSEFKRYFDINETCYMEYFELPHPGWGKTGGLDRIQYYYYDTPWIHLPHNLFGRYFLKLQKKLGIKRSINFVPKIFGGSTYWSLPFTAVSYINAELVKNKGLLRRFLYTRCAEEIWIQTILLNSHKFNVENNNLRYIKWVKYDSPETFCAPQELSSLLCSNAFFARKFISPQSDKLLDLIIENKRNV